jgi:hypothetical protein
MGKKSTAITFSTSPIIENIIRADAIRKGKTISHILTEIIEAHYTKNDLVNRKLNFLLKNHKMSNSVPAEWLEETTLFDLKVSEAEVKASKYPAKNRYIRKHIVNNVEKNADSVAVPVKNILHIDNFM